MASKRKHCEEESSEASSSQLQNGEVDKLRRERAKLCDATVDLVKAFGQDSEGICTEESKNIWTCTQCLQILCTECKELHKKGNQGHAIMELYTVDGDTVCKTIKKRCQEKQFQMTCETCNKLLCIACFLNKHECMRCCINISQAVVDYYAGLQQQTETSLALLEHTIERLKNNCGDRLSDDLEGEIAIVYENVSKMRESINRCRLKMGILVPKLQEAHALVEQTEQAVKELVNEQK